MAMSATSSVFAQDAAQYQPVLVLDLARVCVFSVDTHGPDRLLAKGRSGCPNPIAAIEHPRTHGCIVRPGYLVTKVTICGISEY